MNTKHFTAHVVQQKNVNHFKRKVFVKVCADLDTENTTVFYSSSPQWGTGTADTEIKDPSVENLELKGSPILAWSRYVCSHACSVYW